MYKKLEYKDSQVMLPKLLFTGKFGLSEQDLDELIADGEVVMTTVEGKVRYCWQEIYAP